ncbi:MAG: sporulation inhibitor of replication protein SirA [Bacillaceae bacterium]|nr:sporulation inhibitor of replication protein SirA [Bacillaceae bacterium]
MDKLSLFWLKDDFAFHYYHKSDLLYHFFSQYHSNPFDSVYKKQFQFITRDLPRDQIIQHIKARLGSRYFVHNDKRKIDIQYDYIQLSIECYDKEWIIHCSSLQEAEIMFFEALRGYHSTFFVVNFEEDQYGWLSPVKKEIIL